MSGHFASDEHIESLSHENLKDLARYLARSRDELNVILQMLDRENHELQRKIDNQRKQLAGMQGAIIRLKGEVAAGALDRYRDLAKELFKLADRGLMELDDDDFRRIVDEAEKLGVTDG